MKTDKIYLVGFMGAGKSTVARAMGRATGWRVEDIDERIEARERRTIATIFAQQGEANFRQLERQALSALLADRHTIDATGGACEGVPRNVVRFTANASTTCGATASKSANSSSSKSRALFHPRITMRTLSVSS